jgi:hypothetical protein
MTSAISIRENLIPSGRPIQIGMAATAFLLGYVGPFGSTAAFGQFVSTLFWALIIVLSVGSVQLLRGVVTSLTPSWGEVRRELVLLGVFTLVYTPQVQILIWLFDRRESFSFEGIAELGVKVFAISLWIVAMRFVLQGWRKESIPEVVVPERPRLFQRLDAAQDAAILQLSAEDHYVVVTLSDGTTQRILLRLSDGIAEMDGVEGFATHRSHWVAASAIVGSRRERGRVFLRLSNGAEVPVSRGYQAAFKEAGILD